MKRDKKNRTAPKPAPAAKRKEDAIRQIADAHLDQAQGAMGKPCCTSRCL